MYYIFVLFLCCVLILIFFVWFQEERGVVFSLETIYKGADQLADFSPYTGSPYNTTDRYGKSFVIFYDYIVLDFLIKEVDFLWIYYKKGLHLTI